MGDEDRIPEIIADYIERLENGEEIEPADLILLHPELAEELEARFDALDLLDEVMSPAPLPPEGAPESIAGHRILREIGRGGMGAVYEAEQASMGRRVALKVLSPAFTGAGQAVRRFRQEARAAGRLHHTNIVAVHGMGRERGLWYYTMDLVEGPSLSEVIEELRAEAEAHEGVSDQTYGEQAERIFGTETRDRGQFVLVARALAGVAEALHVAHEAGVIHRDVKPANLLLAPDGTLKLVDFGLARLAGEGASMTVTGQIIGTPYYMSPEQAMARQVGIDHRSDVYSLGATIYELLTLRLPFKGDSLQEVCSQILSKEPALPRRVDPRIPRDLETIVLKAMEKEPERRYQTADDLAQDLCRFAEGLPIRARRVGLPERAWRKVKRNKVKAALVAAIVLLAAAGGLVAFRASREAEGRLVLEYAMLCAEAAEAFPASAARAEGREFEEGHDASEAGGIYEKAIALLPDRPEAYLGRSLAPGRTVEERLSDLDRARERGLSERTWRLARQFLGGFGAGGPDTGLLEDPLLPASATDAYFRARVLDLHGRQEEALDLLEVAVVESEPESAVRYLALRHRAGMRFVQRDHAGTLDDLIPMRKMGDESYNTCARIALAWRGLGQEERAEEGFQEMLRRARAGGAEEWARLCLVCRCSRADDWLERASREAIEMHGDSGEILYYRGSALRRQGAPGEARDMLLRAVELEPERHEFHVELGRSLAGGGDPEGAVERFDDALALRDCCTEALNLKGCILSDDLGRHEEALASFDEAVRLMPLAATYHCNRAIPLLRLGRAEEALAATERSLELQGDYAHAHSIRASVLLEIERYEDALAAAERALELDPTHRGGHETLGTALLRLDRLEEAVEAYRKGVELEPGNAVVRYLLAWTLDRLARYPEALAAYGETVRLDPENALAHAARGRLLQTEGKDAEALDALERAVALGHTTAYGEYLRGVVLQRLDRLEEALAAYDSAIELGCRIADIHYWRANLLARLDRPVEALAAYDEAIALGCSTADVHYGRAMALRRLDRDGEALDALRQAVALDPEHALAHGSLAATLHGAGKLREALAAADRSIELGLSTPLEHYNRGIILQGLNRHEDALEAFATVLELDPAHPRVRNNRGVSLYRLGRHEEALREYEIQVRDHPDNARGHVNLGVTLLHWMGDPEKSLRAFNRAMELDPDFPRLRLDRARALWLVGRYREAIEAAEALLKKAPRDPEALTQASWFLANCPELDGRDPERAVALARRAIVESPRAIAAWRALALASYRSSVFEDALRSLEQAMELSAGGDTLDWLLTAMACARFGRMREARDWYDKAVARMEERDSGDEELSRLRAEAADLLGRGK